MKERIISSVIVLIILGFLIATKGIPFKIAAIIVSLLVMHEMLLVKEKKIPILIRIISYIAVAFSLSYYAFFNESDIKIIAGISLMFLIPIILYHDQKKYNVNDVFHLMISVFLIIVTFGIIIMLGEKNIDLLIYLILTVAFSDTFAFLTGFFIGKHKLIEAISPKKTIEGLIGGLLFSTIFASIYYINVIHDKEMIDVIIMTLFLSLLSQFGDLFFSSMKRYYKRKDFSNLIPGHGGIVDRLDSMMFAVLGFILFL